MSPFVENEKEGYVPNRHKEISHLKGDEVIESDDEEEEEQNSKVEAAMKTRAEKERA